MWSNSQFVATFSRCCFFLGFFFKWDAYCFWTATVCWWFLLHKTKSSSFFFDHSVNPVSLHYSYLWHGCCWVQPLCCKLTGLITPAIHHQIHSLYTMGRRWDKNKLNHAVQLRQLLQTAEEYIVFMFRYYIYETVWGHVEAKRTLFRMNP